MNEESTMPITHTIYNHVCQGRRCAPKKNQDFATSGTSLHAMFDYLVVADGHGLNNGKNIVYEYLSGLNWAQFLEDENFMTKIYDAIHALGNTNRVGSTLTIVLITQNQCEVYWVGDSQCRIYKNLEEIWAATIHDFNNAEEMCRLFETQGRRGHSYEYPTTTVREDPSWRTKVLSSTEITMERAPYFIFNAENKINMTNSLGHNGVCGRFWSEEVINIDNSADYKIVVASDGFWDMTTYTDLPVIASRCTGADELLMLSNERWSQDWEYYCPLKSKKEQEPVLKSLPEGQEDDTSISVWYKGI